MGNGAQFLRRSAFSPWNKPQSIKTWSELFENRNFDPVTPPAAPRNCKVGAVVLAIESILSKADGISYTEQHWMRKRRVPATRDPLSSILDPAR